MTNHDEACCLSHEVPHNELHVGVLAAIAIPHLNIGANRRPPSGDIDALRHMR